VALNNQQDALQSLPPELQQFAQNIMLNSSQLQVLTLQSEEILQQVERILKENPGGWGGVGWVGGVEWGVSGGVVGW
jgi:hypothetical protein